MDGAKRRSRERDELITDDGFGHPPVQLPQQGGVYHDLVVGSCHLSKSQLISVVANGLAH